MTGDRHPGDRLAALADGRLSEPERSRVLAHVATCTRCRAEYDEQRVMKGLLSGLGTPDAPTELRSRLSGLAAPLPAPDPVAPRWRRVVPLPSSRAAGIRVAAVGTAAAGVLVVAGGYLAGGPTAAQPVVPAVGSYLREHSEVATGVPFVEPVVTRLTKGVVVEPALGSR